MTWHLKTPFGALACESGIPFTCKRDRSDEAIKQAHYAAFSRGDDHFVYTRQMAEQDGLA